MKITSKRLTVGLAAASVFVSTQPVLGEDVPGPETKTENIPKYTISIGTEILDGDTTYQIGYPVTMDGVTTEGYFPFSELKWPLDIILARLDGSVTFSGGWKLKGYIKKNITDPDDNMEDSDWITDSNPSRLDIYSESSISSFDATILDLDVEYTFADLKSVSFYAGIGYQYQNFDYDAKLIRQYSPSGLSGYDYVGGGEVGISYGITYHIPYLLLGTTFNPSENFSMNASFAFSPYVSAEDQDHHLLREYGGKVTESSMDGTGIIIDISAKYKFLTCWFMELGFHYTKLEVEGRMDQSYVWYGYFASNDVESETTQTSGYLNIGAHF